MAGADSYKPWQLRKIIGYGLTPKAERDISGGIRAPGYYENNNALVLDAASDKSDPDRQILQTIDTAFDALSNLSDEQKLKKIIIPVAEEQKILGIVPRNHWVTLYYDPLTNQATLLDSRPWLVSFLYPTSSMEQLLTAGLTKIYGTDIARPMIFDVQYQDVQHNDVYCGAWTGKNIRDLAGVDGNGNGNSITQQMDAYTAAHEENIFKYTRQIISDGPITINGNAIPPTPSLFQRFLNAIGLGNTDTNINIAPQIDNKPELSNLAIATQQLQSKTPPKKSTVYVDDWDSDDVLVNTQETNVSAPTQNQVTVDDQIPDTSMRL